MASERSDVTMNAAILVTTIRTAYGATPTYGFSWIKTDYRSYTSAYAWHDNNKMRHASMRGSR